MGIVNENDQMDKHLSEVLNHMLLWKNSSCARIVVRICNRALANEIFYPDEVDHSDIPDADINAVGALFKYLKGKKAGAIITRTATFKRSEAGGRRGSTVFAYTLNHRGMAEALVRRLGARADSPQKEFAL